MDDVIDLGSGGTVEFSLQLSDYLGMLFMAMATFVSKRMWSAAGAHLTFIESQQATLAKVAATVDETLRLHTEADPERFEAVIDILQEDTKQARRVEHLNSAVFSALLAMAATNPEWSAAMATIQEKLREDLRSV